MEVTIEDVEPVTVIDITGKVPDGVNSKMNIKNPQSSLAMIVTPKLLTNSYGISLENGSYLVELFVNSKKAKFTLSESADLTDLIESMIEA